MKKIIILIFLTCLCSLAFGYELGQKTNFGNSLTYYRINNGSKEIAQIYLLDPSNRFHFFSIEDNPKLFSNLNKEVINVSKQKKIKPSYALLADFSDTIHFKRKFNLSYTWNTIEIFLFAPSYLKKVDILDPNDTSQRFFIDGEIDGKEFYSVIIFSKPTDIKYVKKIITETKDLNLKKFKLYSLLNFPIALVNFEGKKGDTIYESNKNVKKYSCLFITGK